MTRLLLLVLLFLSPTTLAQSEGSIYRTTDEQGNVVFTDKPPANANTTEQVEVQRTNTAPPPPKIHAPAHTKPRAAAGEDTDAGYQVTITSPATETSIPMGPGNFSVSASITPALDSDSNLQLFIDGAPHGEPQSEPSWDLVNIFRGQHDLTVGVIDDAGEVLEISGPVRVYVHRPSSNF